MPCTTVAQIITVHRGNHHLVQSHRRDGLGEITGLILIERFWTTVTDIAEGATTGADVTHDHERCGAFAKTFVDVRAGRFLAHGMQLVFAQRFLDLVESFDLRARPQTSANPVGLFQTFSGNDFDRNAGGLVGASLFTNGGFHQTSSRLAVLTTDCAPSGSDERSKRVGSFILSPLWFPLTPSPTRVGSAGRIMF